VSADAVRVSRRVAHGEQVTAIARRIVTQLAILQGHEPRRLLAELERAHGDLPVNPSALIDALPSIGHDLGLDLSTSDGEVRACLYYVRDLATLVHVRQQAGTASLPRRRPARA
jgi:hypothetical protein